MYRSSRPHHQPGTFGLFRCFRSLLQTTVRLAALPPTDTPTGPARGARACVAGACPPDRHALDSLANAAARAAVVPRPIPATPRAHNRPFGLRAPEGDAPARARAARRMCLRDAWHVRPAISLLTIDSPFSPCRKTTQLCVRLLLSRVASAVTRSVPSSGRVRPLHAHRRYVEYPHEGPHMLGR